MVTEEFFLFQVKYSIVKYFLLFLLAFSIPVSFASEVKQTKSGICHCLGGSHYDRIKQYQPFKTIEACLENNGRHPKRGQGECPTESSNQYDRKLFGVWLDEDGDCQNTRHEKLISLSKTEVTLSEEGCYVTTGEWGGPYTGKTYTEAKDLDIDHVVPLYYAWQHGADKWAPEKQQRFGNDPANLLAVESGVNRAKGAAGPLEWMPPDITFHCEYVLRFMRVLTLYGIELASDKNTAIQQLTNDKCD